jgi:hypothetical protein
LTIFKKKGTISAIGGTIVRILRIMVISVVVFLVAWAIKSIMYQGDAQRAEELLQKIRWSGV